MNDICGEDEKAPRHAKAYTNLKKMKDNIELERVRALKSFVKDCLESKFPASENSVNVDNKILQEFLKKI
jgi:3-methyl-2-oxobutanoate hydroxymethyltransferase